MLEAPSRSYSPLNKTCHSHSLPKNLTQPLQKAPQGTINQDLTGTFKEMRTVVFTPAVRPKSNFCPQILGWVPLTHGLPSWDGSWESEKGREPILALCRTFLQLLLLSELLQGIIIW